METLSRDEVLRLARLARLDLSSDEVERFTRQLREILAFAHQVNAVDTASVIEATPELHSGEDSLRDDAVVPSLDRAEVLGLAADADPKSGLFKVPRVFNR